MNVIITSFFTQSGNPATGLTPTIRIWNVEDTSNTLIVPSSGPDPIMSEVGDGFYNFVFTTTLGFDPLKTYVTRTDGGSSLSITDGRYQTSSIDLTENTSNTTTITTADITAIVDGVWNEPTASHTSSGTMGLAQVVNIGAYPTLSQIASAVWDEPASTHLIPGSVGVFQNETHADAQQLRIDVTTALSLLATLLKYETNRTKIDKIAMTLTVYDDDGVTPLKVFSLKDSTGASSVTEVCERRPI
jgi:hypothetical protein